MGPLQTLADLASMIRRRWPLILGIMIPGFLMSLYLAVSSPQVYESSAVIQISAPAISASAQPNGLPASRRVQLIEQWLMVRRNLLEVIARHGLFADTPQLSENEKIDLLRRSARIESVMAPGQRDDVGGQLAAIVITAQASNAATAAALANDFADNVLNHDRSDRQARLAEARAFLEDEETRLRSELASQDRAIADFSALNEGALPASQEFQQAELSRIAGAEALLERDIMALDRERLAIEAGRSGDGQSQSLIQQLRNAENELAQARLSLGPNHPEIQRLQAEIATLSKGGSTDLAPAVQRQLDLISSQLAQMQAQSADLDRRRQQIEMDRQRMPQVGRELDGMLRDQQRMQDRYADASRRLAAVETEQALFDNNQTEQLVLLEPAIAAEYPALSKRRKTAVLGLFSSIALALGAAVALEIARPVLRSPGQFFRGTGIEPLIVLPYRARSGNGVAGGWRLALLIAMILAGAVGAAWIMGMLPGVPSPARGIIPVGTGG